MSALPLIIVNPESAGGATRDAWPRIASDLATNFGAFNCAFTERRGDALRLALDGAQRGRRLIVACGGDGTANEVANGILQSNEDVEFGILPSGTGGDFQRSLRLPARTADAALVLKSGRTRKIDVGQVSYTGNNGGEESRYFLGVASFGMSGDVIRRAKTDTSPWLPTQRGTLAGKLSYAIATLQATLASPSTTALVQLDDGPERRLTVANLCVANARYFGGGMKIAPEAKLNDGYFDVVTVGDLGTVRILSNAHRLYLGTHLGMQKVHHALAKRISARPTAGGESITLEVDGELPGTLPATMEIVPSALRVRVA